MLPLDARRVETFDRLLRPAWANRDSADANFVRIFVSNLRPKFGDSAASPSAYSTQHGIGSGMARPADR